MDIRKFLENIPIEERIKNNKKQLQKTEEMFHDFRNAYEKKCCSLCGMKLNSFQEHEPCFHWFTLPNGIRKKHFKDYLKEPIGYFKLESYFRWISSIEHGFKNINDLSDEMSDSKIREVTIRFNNIEWSLNYGQTDLSGHGGSKNADFPHYHIQMVVDSRPFIRFNDFHIPFSDEDLFNIKLMNEAHDLIDFRHTHGLGMSILENEENLIELDRHMKVAEDESEAPIHTSSMISMPKGKTMSGDVIANLMEKSRKTGVPIRKLLQEKYTEAKIITEFKPGEGVPEMKKRNKR